MSSQHQPLTTVDPASASSSRLLLAIRELNHFTSHPDFGASQDKIKDVIRSRDGRIPIEHDPRNLVALLLKDNEEIFNKLLHNKFCQAMSKAPAGDKAVTDGFKWYMIQDFLYCGRIMVYDTERALKAPDVATYETLANKIKDNTDYAVSLLKTCSDPEKLGVPGNVVIGAKREDVTMNYTDFTVDTVENSNWIVSLVAMVPCIQSYYQIAKLLEKNSLHKDTLWYKLWVEENVKYESSTQHQVAFFIANFETWKWVPYEKLCDIFTQACQHEIDLWAVADHPGRVA